MNLTETNPAIFTKNNPRTLRAWTYYDWANSVYNLVITSTIFPVYYSAVTRTAFGGETVQFLGVSVRNTVLYSYVISFSFLLVVILSPLLSGIADYSGSKKRFMQFFTYLGATACVGLYFFTGENLVYGLSCAVLASVGYAGALVFYNAFLPEIASADRMDALSARGFAMGYIGSVVLLIINLLTITFYDSVGFPAGDAGKLQATRTAFLVVGVWWVGFAQITFARLQDRPVKQRMTTDVFTRGFAELRGVLHKVVAEGIVFTFLLAFFFYSMGLQTVMLLAPLFGEAVIGLSGEKLILTVLILQMVAIGGSFLFASIARRRGNKASLTVAVLIWIGICLAAYVLTTEIQFYLLAAFVGLVMGGTQAISRSTYAKLIPASTTDTASYFSLYDVSEKIAIVLGTFSYGLIEQLTGSMRNSSLGLIVFFAAGLFFLLRARLPKPQTNQ